MVSNAENQWRPLIFPLFFSWSSSDQIHWGIAKRQLRRQVLKLLRRLRSTAGKMGRMENPKAFGRGNVMEIRDLFSDQNTEGVLTFLIVTLVQEMFSRLFPEYFLTEWVALRCFFWFPEVPEVIWFLAEFSLQGRAAPKARTEMDIGLLQPARPGGWKPWRYCHG